MTSLFFVYQDASNRLSAHMVKNAAHKGDYVLGFSVSSNGIRTFRQDRIVEQVADEQALAERLAYWQS